MYNDMKMHVNKFRLCPKMILGFIILKKGQLLNPKKIHAIVNMPILEINNRFKYLMAWYKFIGILLKILHLSWHLLPN
jgi:hypothetical protein